VWRRRSRRSVATSTVALLAGLSCFAISGDGWAEAADCVGSASATTTTLVASSPGVVTTTTVAATTSTTSTSSTLAEEATSTTAVTTTVVGSDPVPPVEVPEVPVPALLGVGGAVVFFGYALLERRRRLA